MKRKYTSKLLLIGGLVGLLSCNDVKIRSSEPKRIEVQISQEYIPERTEIKKVLIPRTGAGVPIGGGYEIYDKKIKHPEEYITQINSLKCQETLKGKKVYDYFQQNKDSSLLYKEVFKDKYKKGNLVESKRIGCNFIIPSKK